nr:glycosyltransferase [Ruegeria halocynthiae]
MGVSLDLNRSSRCNGVQGSKYAVGTISRLSKKKGIHHLIDAAELLAMDGQPVPLGLAGDGEDAEDLKARPIHADTHFTGFLSGSEKAGFFGDCFAMAFPSVNAEGDVEGMPVSLLEALVSGKPVIASKATNIELLPEWQAIKDDVEFLDDPADTAAFACAIKRILSLNLDEIQNRSRRLQHAMRHYTWDCLIEEYLSVADSVNFKG